MEVSKTTNRIHPLVAAASVSVMLVSLVGVAAITGVLPTSHGTTPAAAPVAAVVTPAAPAATVPGSAAPSTSVSTASVAKPVMPTESKLAATDEVAPPAPAKPAARPVVKHKPSTSHAASPNYSPAPAYSQAPTQVAQAPAICHSCGRVESVQAVQTQAAPSGLGAVAGGVVGGLLGNQVGGGNGKTLATVAGAVGGGFAGHEIEKRTRTASAYQVRVRMEDGRVRTFPYNGQPNWSVGDRVKVVDGYLAAQG